MYCEICMKAKKSNRSHRAEMSLHAICRYGYGTYVHGSGTCCCCCTCSLQPGLVQNSLQPFLRWMTVPQIARLKIKCERFMVKLF